MRGYGTLTGTRVDGFIRAASNAGPVAVRDSAAVRCVLRYGSAACWFNVILASGRLLVLQTGACCTAPSLCDGWWVWYDTPTDSPVNNQTTTLTGR